MQATAHAFAAILHDGSAVTWFSPGGGGDSSGVLEQLRNLHPIDPSGLWG